MERPKFRVFISYSHEDQPLVERMHHAQQKWFAAHVGQEFRLWSGIS